MENQSDNEKIKFTINNWKYLITDDPIVKELVNYLEKNLWKNEFTIWEISQTWDTVQERINNQISSELENMLWIWFKEWWKFEKVLVSQIDDDTSKAHAYGIENSNWDHLDKEIHSGIGKYKYPLFIWFGCIFIIFILYTILSGRWIVKNESQETTISWEKKIEGSSQRLVDKKIEWVDAKLLGNYNLTWVKFPEALYSFDWDIYYTESEYEWDKIITTFYNLQQEKIIEWYDSAVIYDIVDGKKTYVAWDSEKNSYLYINDKQVWKNKSTVMKFGDKNVYNSNSFNYKKYWNNILYTLYTWWANTFDIYYNWKKIIEKTKAQKFYYLDDTLYTFFLETDWKYSLYRNDEKIASATDSYFVIQKIGNSICYQLKSWTYQLYCWWMMMWSQDGNSINFTNLEWKVAYDLYDISTNMTSLFWGNEVIAKIKDSRSINGLTYWSLNGEIYYSYFGSEGTWSSMKKENYIVIKWKTYTGFSGYIVFWENRIAIKKYNNETDMSELYIDNMKVFSITWSVVDLWEYEWKLYYTTYDKENKIFTLIYDGNLINTSTQPYYFQRVKNGLFYRVFNPDTGIESAYMNDRLIASWVIDSGILYLEPAIEWVGFNGENTLAYTKNQSGKYILHWMNWEILLEDGEKIGRIQNDATLFYISKGEKGKDWFSIYELK